MSQDPEEPAKQESEADPDLESAGGESTGNERLPLDALSGAFGALRKRVGALITEVGDAVTDPQSDAFDMIATSRRRAEAAEHSIESLLERGFAPRSGELQAAFGASANAITGVEFADTTEPGPAGERDCAAALRSAVDAWGRRHSSDLLDATRRIRSRSGQLSSDLREEARVHASFWTAIAYDIEGDQDRVLLSLSPLLSNVAEGFGVPWLRRLIDLLGEAALGRGELEIIERMRAICAPREDGDPTRQALSDHLTYFAARSALAKRDRPLYEAHRASLEASADTELRHGDWLAGVLVELQLRESLRFDLEAQPSPTEMLQDSATDRLALISAFSRVEHKVILPTLSSACVAAAEARGRLGLARRAELAALILGLDLATPVLDLSEALLKSDCAPVDQGAPELELLALRAELERGDLSPASRSLFGGSGPASYRPAQSFEPFPGPDESSPLRNSSERSRSLWSAAWLLNGEVRRREGSKGAVDAYRQALALNPERSDALRAIAALRECDPGGTLEDWLLAAAASMQKVPDGVGAELKGVLDRAASQVREARSSLTRPLCIAVMGEFSSGKSTFVNALVGDPVAPMGALPTTCTINLFRRGPAEARVHHRDGRIESLARGDAKAVFEFLTGLDPQRAAEIRHVEIDHPSVELGSAMIVDTPGLNSLDPYHERVAREFLERADAVIWVFSATRGSTRSESEMLAELSEGGRQVLGVLNKTDILDAGEVDELVAYLREMLGDVLVEVCPLSAQAGLDWSSSKSEDKDQDPLGPMRSALEHHFLGKARELKRALAERQLRYAITEAREALRAEIGSAEVSSSQESEDLAEGLVQLREELTQSAQHWPEAWARAFGMTQAGGGEAPASWLRTRVTGSAVGESQQRYLASVLRRVIREDLRRLTRTAPEYFDGFREQLAQGVEGWLEGYLEGIESTGWVAELCSRSSRVSGESAQREAVRAPLAELAEVLGARVTELRPRLEEAQAIAKLERVGPSQARRLELEITMLDPWTKILERSGQAAYS